MTETIASDRNVEAMADELMAALGTARPVRPFTRRSDGLSLDAAYAVAGRVHNERLARGECPLGRKIGFTNRALWPLFGAEGPMWGWLYEGTVRDLASLPNGFDLAGLAEPRLEPEIALCLSRTPEAGMDEAELLGCVGWVAPAFELVQSVYPGWAFGAADAVAGLGLHGALVLGERHDVADDPEAWHAALSCFSVELRRDGELVTCGQARDVLGGPLSALRWLVDDLAHHHEAPPLGAGEVVTTGTLTGAHPVAPGQRWSLAITGAPLRGLELRLR